MTVDVDYLEEAEDPSLLSQANDEVIIEEEPIILPATDPIITRIHTIQGEGLSSPLAGQAVTVEAIVVGEFQGGDNLQGFYLQEEDANADDNPLTSEGIFVFTGRNPQVSVSVGDKVQVTGSISEFANSNVERTLTQLTRANVQVVNRNNPLPTATELSFPVDDVLGLESFEGMRVTIPQTMTVTGNFNLNRFGEVDLSSGGLNNEPNTDDRLDQFTQFNPPSQEAFTQYQSDNARRSILLDDGRGINLVTNNQPVIHGLNGQPLGIGNTLRAGDTATGITGILDDRFDNYRIQPTEQVMFTEANSRPTEPEEIGGSLRVGVYNIENYFNGVPDENGVAIFNRDNSRGAQSQEEFENQNAKLVPAITDLDADILALVELENDFGDGERSAIADLVSRLNSALGEEVYSFVDPGVPQIGTDMITVGYIYKPETVGLMGNPAILDSSVDPRFDDQLSRPVLAQTFTELATGEVFTMAANHFKSKSGPRAGQNPDPRDLDQGDGQGFWNYTRTQAAEAMVDWLATDPTNSGDPDFLIGGDTNTYAHEDPLTAQEAAGYTPLFPKESYSFVFRGQAGSLDHMLANDSMLEQVTGATKWHINVDEPNAFEYSQRFFAPDPFRSADHDPLVIGLDLTSTPTTPEFPTNVSGTSGDDNFDSELPGESGFIGDSQNLFTGSGNDTVDVSLAVGGNRIDLGSGDDLIFAGSDNRILAGSGDDILFLGNGNGNNVVTGGPGADQFWLVTDTGALPTNSNIITDFTPGEDVIGFANTELSFADLTLSQGIVNGQTRTTVNALGEELAILLNVSTTELSAANFVFA
ncbi:MAG: ExeM/NucH family extracellular endonuclease [Gloeocapsa sp. DLM2.Bin57]|nr:MAG: ExeM/NucH family extracellular endonuclease [Gloeocapsa sp. DLM2.Bin57]